MTRLLITAFEPFDNNQLNASLEALNQLNDGDKCILPTVFSKAGDILIDKIENYDLCIMLGEARGRKKISLEMVAINYIDARIKDNDGVQIVNQKIVDAAPDAYFSNIDVYNLSKALDNKNDTMVSYSAGTFICNEIYYRTLHYINKNNLSTKAIFIHVPDIADLNTDIVCNILKDVIDKIAL